MKTLRILCSFLILGSMLGLISCDTIDDSFELDLIDPNNPTPEVLRSEEGIKRLSAGYYESIDLADPKNFVWIVQAYHELMGDALVTPWGNWQYRWVAQISDITLDDGSVFIPPAGGSQPDEISRTNNRQLAAEDPVVQEWGSMYFLNNQANLMIETLNEGTVEFSGDADAKTNGYLAIAHFWKGYAYARIGSMYEQGLIIDAFGATNTAYVDRAEVIAESNRQFDLAIAHASGVDAVREDAFPDLLTDSEVSKPTSASLAAAANTLKARNILVNTRRVDLSSGDWQEILALTQNGLQDNSGTLILRSDDVTYPDEVWWIFQAAWGPWGWHRVSERLIQDIQPDDERMVRFEQTLNADTGNPISWNTRGRGIQYNSSWRVASHYATQTSTEDEVKWYFVSFEENLLMQAEAQLALGNAADAAALIDQVRAYQGAGLDPVDPSGNVWEQIRSERRIGLFLRGLAFYDARRQGVLDPVSMGGGRTGAVVIDNSGAISTNATINYNYLSYWPIPDAELDFNRPSGGDPGNIE